jgi:hypothetical protein
MTAAIEQGTANFKRFARTIGVAPSYVAQLKDEGRLVLTDDGKRVRVAESIARIKASADPAKAPVAARHAANREARAGVAAVAAPIAPPAPAQPQDATTIEATAGDLDRESSGFSYWRSRNEKAKALASERENAVADGKLLDAGEVTAAVAAAITTLRTRFESLPDVLGPQLAGVNDEAQARALLAEAIEHALDEAARQFSNLAKQVTA